MEELYPREKLLKYGVENLSNSELIAIILRKGTKGKNVFEISKELLKEFGSLYNLFKSDINELRKIKGLGVVGSVTLKAAFELGKRYHFEYISKHSKNKIKIKNFFTLYEICLDMIYMEKEVVRLLSLNSKSELIASDDITMGTVNNTLIHPREVFKKAIERNAVSIILVHNHPTGDSQPSLLDIEITDRLFKASEIIGIKLLDHVIIGKGELYSFKIKRRVIVDEWKRSGNVEKDFRIEEEV